MSREPWQAASLPDFAHIIVIVMENKNYADVIGNPAAPYINGLATQFALATNYTAVAHPSLPNYMALTGGHTFFEGNCDTCTVRAPGIADQIEQSGRTWKAYMEGMPSPCLTRDTGRYAARHNPFIHYTDLVRNPRRCAAHVVPLTELETDLATAHLPNFLWITPDLCSDMHDCDIATGDMWLAKLVPGFLHISTFANGVLFIVWDEAEDGSDGGHVPLLVISPRAIPGMRSHVPENHYSLLCAIEDAWGLPPLGEAMHARSVAGYFRGNAE
jgi:acid phosphatase